MHIQAAFVISSNFCTTVTTKPIYIFNISKIRTFIISEGSIHELYEKLIAIGHGHMSRFQIKGHQDMILSWLMSVELTLIKLRSLAAIGKIVRFLLRLSL